MNHAYVYQTDENGSNEGTTTLTRDEYINEFAQMRNSR